MTARACRAHGLSIISEWPLPDFPDDADPAADPVHVRRAPLAPLAAGARAAGDVRFALDAGTLRFDVPGLARFAVASSGDVTIDADPSAGLDDVAAVLNGTVMAAVALRRGLIPLHASAVASASTVGSPPEAVAFVGASGAGKSTLAAQLAAAGHAIVADDLVVLHPSPTGPTVAPGLRRLRLWHDSALRLGHDPHALDRIVPGLDKYRLAAAHAPIPAALPLRALYRLEEASEGAPRVARLSGAEATGTLLDQTYRPELVKLLGLAEDYMRLCAQVAATLACYAFRRTRDFSPAPQLVGLHSPGRRVAAPSS